MWNYRNELLKLTAAHTFKIIVLPHRQQIYVTKLVLFSLFIASYLPTDICYIRYVCLTQFHYALSSS